MNTADFAALHVGGYTRCEEILEADATEQLRTHTIRNAIHDLGAVLSRFGIKEPALFGI